MIEIDGDFGHGLRRYVAGLRCLDQVERPVAFVCAGLGVEEQDFRDAKFAVVLEEAFDGAFAVRGRDHFDHKFRHKA